jgi:hypothetical protein
MSYSKTQSDQQDSLLGFEVCFSFSFFTYYYGNLLLFNTAAIIISFLVARRSKTGGSA